MKRTIGHYDLGQQSVKLVLRDGDGGEFYTVPAPGKPPSIVIGSDYDEWRGVVEVLHHEAMEFAMTAVGCRYKPSPDAADDHGSYIFFMTHAQFSDASARAAEFMAGCLPDLARAWRKAR